MKQAQAIAIDPTYSEAKQFFVNKFVNPNDYKFTTKKRNPVSDVHSIQNIRLFDSMSPLDNKHYRYISENRGQFNKRGSNPDLMA